LKHVSSTVGLATIISWNLAWWALWQDKQLISFLSCGPPRHVSRCCSRAWHWRHDSLACAVVSLGGLMMSLASRVSIGFVPSRWQLSHVVARESVRNLALLPGTSRAKDWTIFLWHC